jgi:hypothetical protein
MHFAYPKALEGAFLLYINASCHCERSEAISSNDRVIASVAKQSPRNDIILSCHCERSEAISFTPGTTEITTSQAPRNDIILSCHCEHSEAISSTGLHHHSIKWVVSYISLYLVYNPGIL